jgi:hypothetical protein
MKIISRRTGKFSWTAYAHDGSPRMPAIFHSHGINAKNRGIRRAKKYLLREKQKRLWGDEAERIYLDEKESG